jgi:hypothetical protein
VIRHCDFERGKAAFSQHLHTLPAIAPS